MYEKVKTYVKAHRMIEESDAVVMGVSGGPDSVCLLLVLEMLQQELGFRLAAVHVHHGLRGEHADRDEAFVASLCEERQIPLLTVRRDVAAYAAEHKLSVEEAGREVRREAYRAATEQYGGTKIALAHHMDDNGETLLLNLARGTGLKGMAGIRPVAGEYIRPLLGVRRSEIEEFLEQKNVRYCIDETNLEDHYTRNKIRNHIIPYLENEINDRTIEHMSELAEQMAALGGYVERQIEQVFAGCVEHTEQGYRVYCEKLSEADSALWPYLIRKVIAAAAGREKDIQAVHVQEVLGLIGKQSGRRTMLPYGLEAVKEHGDIVIRTRRTRREELEEVLLCRPGEPDGERWVSDGIFIKIHTVGSQVPIPEKRDYTKWFDYDIIKDDVIIRSRRPGDFLDIDDKGHTQKLKKYMINARIPSEQKERVPLVAEQSQILWVVGYRQNQRYQISGKTRRILEIQFTKVGGKEDGRDD